MSLYADDMILYIVVVLQLQNHVGLFVTPWTVARQAPLSVGFSRQEYWSRLPFPSPAHPPLMILKFSHLTCPKLDPRLSVPSQPHILISSSIQCPPSLHTIPAKCHQFYPWFLIPAMLAELPLNIVEALGCKA